MYLQFVAEKWSFLQMKNKKNDFWQQIVNEIKLEVVELPQYMFSF